MFSIKQPNYDSLQPVLTVSELTTHIKDVLETEFDFVLVSGEISNAKLYPSGHWYFSLKDKEATLPCVCFKNSSLHMKFKLEDGLMVVARGKLSVYPPRGAYQMVVTSLEPVGIGAWQLAFDQLRKQLESEGLLDIERKRPIPLAPRRIGVVTSPVGAAVRDIISALTRRNKSVNVVIAPAKVQGEGSVEEIVEAISYLQCLPDIDVILVARGGGSIEDLWSFNTEAVARAVANSSVPVISGVGHETDVTICDLVADLRAPTPTAAAELVSRASAELSDKWEHLDHKLWSALEMRMKDARRKLERLDPWHSLKRYQERLKRLDMNVLHRRNQMISLMSKTLTQAQNKLNMSRQRLLALNPKGVMNRGFSVVRKPDGEIVNNTTSVRPGETLEILLLNGSLLVKIEEIRPATSTAKM